MVPPLQTKSIPITNEEEAKKVYVCPAHPYLDREMRDLKEAFETYTQTQKDDNDKFKKEINEKLDPVINFIQKKEARDSILAPFKDLFWKILSGVLVLIIMALIYFYTFL
jgi:hypothetical protein